MDERRLFELSEMQHNLVSRAQARRLGVDRAAIARRVRRGDWIEVSSRVLRRAGAADDVEEPIMATVLHHGEDAMASLRAAAWLWGIPGYEPGHLDVIRDRTLAGGSRPHRPRFDLDRYRTVVRGVPVTTLPVTLLQLAGTGAVSYARLDRIVGTILGRAPALLAVFESTLAELARSGRPGVRLFREVLAQQELTSVPLTGLERRFETILRNAGERPMERQVDLGGHSWVGRVDYLDRSLLLVAEIDSVTFHSSRPDVLRDAERDTNLLAAGWRKVLRIPEEWIWYEPWRVVEAVREARRALRTAAA
jgi:very-short-patch-repair endonuclease